MFRLLALIFLLGALAAPVPACLNDAETQTYEEEFESEYMQQEAPMPESAPPAAFAMTTKEKALNIGVAVLLLGVLLFAFRGDLRVIRRV